MKYGIFPIIGLCIILIGCRSSHSVSRDAEIRTQTEQTTTTTTRTDSTRAASAHRDSTTTTTDVSEFTRITTYSDSGGIQAVQEQWRHTGSAQLSVSSGRTAALSVTDQKADRSSVIGSMVNESIQEQNTADNRPVQGIEWLWVVLSGVIVVLIGLMIVLKKIKR